ncbi:MAG: response regulator transcription factor [Chloroflexi bacterium]|nr:response regulator transcription factor [Chloroflexota bacterium]
MNKYRGIVGTRLKQIYKILLADDHPMLRHGIKELLEREPDFEVIGEASDGEEAIDLAIKYAPDVILMDIGMPKISGLEATKRIKKEKPDIAILVLTIHDEDEYIVGLLEAGAAGYLLKSAYGKELVQSIRAICNGEYVFHPEIGKRLLKRALNKKTGVINPVGLEKLTNREIEVLNLASRGLSNKEIAIKMGIGVRTVKGYMVNIFSKMRVASRTEAVLNALKLGWVNIDSDSGV